MGEGEGYWGDVVEASLDIEASESLVGEADQELACRGLEQLGIDEAKEVEREEGGCFGVGGSTGKLDLVVFGNLQVNIVQEFGLGGS